MTVINVITGDQENMCHDIEMAQVVYITESLRKYANKTTKIKVGQNTQGFFFSVSKVLPFISLMSVLLIKIYFNGFLKLIRSID